MTDKRCKLSPLNTLSAHKLGIKTLYYLRTESVLRGDNLQRLSECISCEG